MRALPAVVVGVIGVALVAAGCGGAIPSSNGGPAAVKVSSSGIGSHLVDAQGHTLYVFMRDARGESYCDGACAAVWPPLETESMPRGAGGLDGAALGTIKRSDGDTQVTYRGRPLYYYAGDASTPGRTNGEQISQFGAEWYVVSPGGTPVEKRGASHGKPGAGYGNTGSNQGGGYR